MATLEFWNRFRPGLSSYVFKVTWLVFGMVTMTHYHGGNVKLALGISKKRKSRLGSSSKRHHIASFVKLFLSFPFALSYPGFTVCTTHRIIWGQSAVRQVWVFRADSGHNPVTDTIYKHVLPTANEREVKGRMDIVWKIKTTGGKGQMK